MYKTAGHNYYRHVVRRTLYKGSTKLGVDKKTSTRVLQIITPPLRGALIFTLFWGFRKFRGALIFFKKIAEILGCVYLHGFWWGALIFTFFLVDFSKDLHCKTPVLQKFSRCAGQISGERLFSHFFEERLLFSLFSFQKILKSAYYFEKIL